MSVNLFYSAVLLTLICAIIGLGTNALAFRRFAISAVKPLLGWTIASQATICAALAAVEITVLLARLGQDGLIDSSWGVSAENAHTYLTFVKVALSGAMIFSSAMMLGLLWRIDKITLKRAAICSVTWTVVLWLIGALLFEFVF